MINIKLVKAIWAAGFRSGHEFGSDSAFAYEHGCRSQKPQDPESAWKDIVQWCIDTDTSSHLDISDPKSWENIP